MSFTQEQIDHIQKLARLGLTEDEKKQYTQDLGDVFSYFELLQEVDTSGIHEKKSGKLPLRNNSVENKNLQEDLLECSKKQKIQDQIVIDGIM